MIFTITLWLILASFVAWAVFLDLKRADQRHRARVLRRNMEHRLRERERGAANEWAPRDLSKLIVTINADISAFAESMQRAGQSAARWRNAVYPNLIAEPLRCHWCQILGRVGLAPHAVHYQPRHRAGRA